MKKNRGSLGKGLAAILGSAVSANNDQSQNISNDSNQLNKVQEIFISNISLNPFQPRKNFEIEKLNELSISIEQLGIIQPITVRKLKDKKYQLISGERRLRASKIAGIKKIPAYIRIANDQQMLEMALVENIQRENLNPIEIALSYKRLIDEVKLTQEQCSEKVGKNRSTITNFLRLLNLPEVIQKSLKDKTISNGHARALLSVKDEESQINLFNDILQFGYSVRDVEQIAKEFSNSKYKQISNNKKTNLKSFSSQKLEFDLTNFLNTKIQIKQNNSGKGSVVIYFKDNDDLKRIIKQIK